MAELPDIYDATRKEISNLVSGLSEEQLATPVPATPEWTVRDVLSHLTGDAACVIAGDFPREFFESFGAPDTIVSLNRWTDKQVTERRDKPLQEVIDEWDTASRTLTPMMRGDTPWPAEELPFAAHILLADLATHQQDIYGALGMVQDRDSAQVKIGTATFLGGLSLRLIARKGPSLRLVMENKEFSAGDSEPTVTVRLPRYEAFRALSGRRNPDQIRAYDWDGDPDPFVTHFYPYGVREAALTE